MRILDPNIERPGRIARGALGASLVIIGAVALLQAPLLGVALIAVGAFSIFQGASGWCVLRACRLRTPF
ncbi:MAG: DUF2892 domain-containing protein [Vicinamibacteria bacterium]|nr:DUF2892 domain-containing protein [Vicinamibacteria bacterium]